MLYYSEFSDINGKAYRVEVVTDNSTLSRQSFTLGGNPFVTQMDSDGKHIYAPIKSTGATVTIVTRNINFNLYSGSIIGNSVKLLSGTNWNTVEWTGYVSPCMYDQGFGELEEVEIECIDGISALKNIPYRSVNPERQVVKFSELINRILASCKCYRNFYISDNVQLKDNATESVIDIFRISENNFFDEKDDINQPDDDVAWNCYDVLYEICQYLGYSLIPHGDEIFIVDYDAIKQNNNYYFKYAIGSNMTPARVQLTESMHIEGNTHANNSANVSLDEVYNKVTIKDDFHTFDNIFPEFGDEDFEQNITMGTYDNRWSYYNSYNSFYKNYPSDNFTEKSQNGRVNNYCIWICNGWKNRLWVCIAKFYDSPVFDFLKYGTGNVDNTSSYTKDMSWPVVLTCKGATYCRFWHRAISSSEYNSWRVNYAGTWTSMSETARKNAWYKLLNQDASKIALEPIIIMKNDSANHIDRNNVYNYPFIKLKAQNTATVFGGEDAYILIKGSVLYHDEQNTPFPLSDGANNGDLKREKDCKRGEEMYLPAFLKWGNQYWNGDGWTTNPSTFPIRFGLSNQGRHYNRDYYSNKKIYDKYIEFIDTAQSVYGCTEKGVYIPCPPEANLQGSIEFSIYANRDMYGDSYHGHWDGYNRYCSYVQVLRNFKFEAHIDNGILDDRENDSDTIFTNTVVSDAVAEMSTIKFKICTNDNKKPNYSSVDYLDTNGESHYITTTFNKALKSLENSTNTSSTEDAAGLKQEEHMIFKLVNQYEKPRKILDANLKNHYKPYTLFTDKTLSGVKFIIQEIGVDYKNNSSSIKLIEKA